MSNDSCANCTAWKSEPTAGRGVGNCLAGSPQVVIINGVPRTFFPRILWTGWCRQHKRCKVEAEFSLPPEDKSGLPLPLPELTPEQIALKAGSMMPGGGPNPRRIVSQEVEKGQRPAQEVQSAAEIGQPFRPKTLQQALAEKK